MTDRRFDSRLRPETIQDAAAWFVRLRASDGRGSRPAFARWRLRDQGRARAYREIEEVWTLAGEASGDAEIEALAEEIAPTARVVKTGGRRATGAWSRRAACGALVMALAGAGAALWGPKVLDLGRATAAPEIYETALGEQRDVALTDGSTVRLDTASRVSVHLGRGGRREVRLLAGQARFAVAKDASRPFVVLAGKAGVTALGTVFDVRLDAREIDVALFEGAVEVRRDQTDPGAGRVALSPGQGVRIASGPLRVEALEGGVAGGWTEGRLVFTGAPLSRVAEEVNRYSARKIVLELPAADARRFRGEFRAGDVDGAVLVLSTLYDLKVAAGGNGDAVLSEKSSVNGMDAKTSRAPS